MTLYLAECEKCNATTDQEKFEVNAEVYDICQVCFHLNNLRYEGFHVKDGLYFRRLDDGKVMIFKTGRDEYENIETKFVDVIDPLIWASIICSVSQLGENYDRWVAAKYFHDESKSEPPLTK